MYKILMRKGYICIFMRSKIFACVDRINACTFGNEAGDKRGNRN